MAVSKKTIKIGVIAEEKNDVEVLYEYTAKLVLKGRFSFASFVGHGCGKLRKKCRAWSENLLQRGCSYLVVIHDRDQRNGDELRQELESQIEAVSAKAWVVLIPVQELEAWLLADAEAIRSVFNMRRIPRISRHPETIESPKEFLRDIVSRHSKSNYLNTVHNKKIAARQEISTLDRCPSFSQYPKFLKAATA